MIGFPGQWISKNKFREWIVRTMNLLEKANILSGRIIRFRIISNVVYGDECEKMVLWCFIVHYKRRWTLFFTRNFKSLQQQYKLN